MPLPRPKPLTVKKSRRPKAASWVWLQELEEIEGTWCDGEIINYAGWKTVKYKESAHDVIILAEWTTKIKENCPCGAPTSEVEGWGFTDVSYARDLPIRCKRSRLYYKLRRWRCKKCAKTLQQPMLGVVGNRHPLTVRLYEYIERESFNIFRTFSNIADETGVHELAVRDIFTARAAQLDKIKLIETPRWIAIDEVYPKKKNEPRCVVSAPEFRRVLDLLPDNKRVTITKWLLNLPDRHSVAVVTMDMWDPYRSVVRRLLPGAAIVVDRYHVHNLLSVALKQVIKVVRDSMTYTERRTYMRREELLLKNYRRLSKERGKGKNGKERPSEKELVEQWLEEVPDIKTAHSLAKEFSDILQLSDRQKAEELTDLWLERVCKFVEDFRAKYRGNYREDDWPDPFGNVPNTITHWRENILNYINYKGRFGINVTNGFAEFANKQIKKAQKLGNYSFEALRHKVVHGGVLVKRRPPHPLDEKRSRRKRRQATDDNVGRREKNPQANVVRLQRARRERDETEGLLPKPQDSLGWATRFESADQLKSDCATNEQGFDKTQHGADRRPRSSVRIDPEQGTLF